MKKASLIFSSFLILLTHTGVMAQNPKNDDEPLDLNSVTYIEEENAYDLGFNTEDYLPLDFDPTEYYVDLDSIDFIDEVEAVADYSAFLPHDFNAYAYPSYFRSIDYLDPSDAIDLDLDTAENLPEGFDPFERIQNEEIISL
ncbi:MAG: hypothetical protein WBM43_06030 [Flavobacteriaceae bacterium]